MISPAHAFNPKNGKPAFLSVDPSPINLGSRKIVKTDRIDISALKLTGEEVDQIFETSVIITEEMVDKAYNLLDQSVVVLEGYPANKNKQKIRTKKITRNLFQISFNSLVENYFPDDVYIEGVHFAYEYNEKELFDDNGQKINKARQLAGMSGGLFKAVINENLSLPLGIFLAQDKGKPALVGLDYRVIFQWLKVNIGGDF